LMLGEENCIKIGQGILSTQTPHGLKELTAGHNQ
jgi:hypothetical protein